MKTLIINEEITSFVDFEHGRSEVGKKETKIGEDSSDYYHALCRKAFKSSSLKELTIGKHHQLFELANEPIEKAAEYITDGFYTAGKNADIMPNASVVTIRGNYGGDDIIIAVKTDHKPAPYNSASKDNVRIVKRQLLPASPKADEAVIVNFSAGKAYIIEKKYTSDGKMEALLNGHWIKGEVSKTDKEKESMVRKIIGKVQEEKPDDSYIPKLKTYLSENAVTESPVNIRDTVEAAVGKNTADEYLEENGVSDSDEMTNYSASSKVTVAADNGIKVTAEASQLTDGVSVVIEDGKIIISGFESYKIR